MITHEFPYSAVILDLDGVVTDTRALHFEAWKETFDEFLPSLGIRKNFDHNDYRQYVDGKPREEGIRSFLGALQVRPNQQRVPELALKKNQRYLHKLRQRGPVVFQDSIRAIQRWKDDGIPVAVVSSSKNCSEVLVRAGLSGLFDAQVDSITAEKSHLRGKPYADYFLEAARRLGKSPEECAIVEDSIAGIRAGVQGHFKGVIGMSREGQTPAESLYSEGADLVVHSLDNIKQKGNALKNWASIKEKIGQREVALFLDFDGTISEIASHPSMARLRTSIAPMLKTCARGLKMAIVSGRDRQDLKSKVNVEDLFYAGCHGFDISGPGGFHYEVEEAVEVLPELFAARELLPEALQNFEGAVIEHKKYFTAVHYRKVDLEQAEQLKHEVLALVQRFQRLEIREGKKVLEISPKLSWGKGQAIKKLCQVLDISLAHAVTVYVGDDLTDEDAFKALKHQGIGIKVGEDNMADSHADYWVESPREVEELLRLICRDFGGSEKRWRPGA